MVFAIGVGMSLWKNTSQEVGRICSPSDYLAISCSCSQHQVSMIVLQGFIWILNLFFSIYQMPQFKTRDIPDPSPSATLTPPMSHLTPQPSLTPPLELSLTLPPELFLLLITYQAFLYLWLLWHAHLLFIPAAFYMALLFLSFNHSSAWSSFLQPR